MGTSRRGCSSQRPVDPAGLVTSCARGRRRCRGAACARGRRCGASGCCGCCRCSQLTDGLLWCFGVSRLSPRRLLTADAAALTPSPRPCCWEGGGFRPWADGAPARPCSERRREAELFACCVVAASSSASTAGAFATPRRLQALGSRATAWPRRQGSGTPAGRVAVRQRRRSRLHWRIDCCRATTRARTAKVRSCTTGLQPDGVRADCHSPHGAHPTQERPAPGVDRCSPHGLGPAQALPVQVVARVARRPCRALGVEGPTPRQAGALPPRVRRAAHASGRWRRDGAGLAPIRSCSTRWPRRRCTPAWGRGVARLMPSESSETQAHRRLCKGC
jgi:hypothetical protein